MTCCQLGAQKLDGKFPVRQWRVIKKGSLRVGKTMHVKNQSSPCNFMSIIQNSLEIYKQWGKDIKTQWAPIKVKHYTPYFTHAHHHSKLKLIVSWAWANLKCTLSLFIFSWLLPNATNGQLTLPGTCDNATS